MLVLTLLVGTARPSVEGYFSLRVSDIEVFQIGGLTNPVGVRPELPAHPR
ncbi:hypothetical protein ACLTEW_01890 [Gordonia lacunae]|nr:hypothetical protein [Gordonia lacunae]